MNSTHEKLKIFKTKYDANPRLYKLILLYSILVLIIILKSAIKYKIFKVPYSVKHNPIPMIAFSVITILILWVCRIWKFKRIEYSRVHFFLPRIINWIILFPVTVNFTIKLFKINDVYSLLSSITLLVGTFLAYDTMFIFMLSPLNYFKGKNIRFIRGIYAILLFLVTCILILIGSVNKDTWFLVPVIVTCITLALDEKIVKSFISFYTKQSFDNLELTVSWKRSIYLVKLITIIAYTSFVISYVAIKIKFISYLIFFIPGPTGKTVFDNGYRLFMLQAIVVIFIILILNYLLIKFKIKTLYGQTTQEQKLTKDNFYMTLRDDGVFWDWKSDYMTFEDFTERIRVDLNAPNFVITDYPTPRNESDYKEAVNLLGKRMNNKL